MGLVIEAWIERRWEKAPYTRSLAALEGRLLRKKRNQNGKRLQNLFVWVAKSESDRSSGKSCLEEKKEKYEPASYKMQNSSTAPR